MIVICLVVAVVGAIVLTLGTDKEYSATSALLLRPSAAFEPQRQVDTNLQLLALPEIAERTAAEIPGASSAEVSEAVSSSQQGESDIIQVEAMATGPELAARIANTFAEQFVEFQEAERQTNQQVETGEIEVVERAVADDAPVSPNPSRNVAFGALIGLVLGVGLALLLEQLDRRVKRQHDLPEVTGLPLVATVPRREAFDARHLGHGSFSPAEAEIFLMLRANLRYFNARKEVRSVLVTSAQPGEGKTLTSIGLALGAAMSGERALLVEADMRDPSIAGSLAVRSPGLSWLLSTPEAELAQAVAQVDVRRLAPFAGEATLDVITAGTIPPNPTQLVESDRMKKLLREAEQQYDFVVVDSPPILLVADAIPLVGSVGGVLAVSGLGVSTVTSANELADQLERMDAATLGLVANFATNTGRSYDGYGYGRPPDALIKGASSAQ